MRAARWLVAGMLPLAAFGCHFESSAIGAAGTGGDANGKASGARTGNGVSASSDDGAGMSGTASGGSGHETGGSNSTGSGGSGSNGTGGANGNAAAGSNGGGTAGSNGSANAGSNSNNTGGSGSGAIAGSNSNATGGMSSSGSSGNANAGSNSGGTGGTGGLPADGNQLSVCTGVQGQCNQGFACYSSPSIVGGTGRGFCSKLCSNDSDCEGLEPTSAKYVCQTGVTTPVCEIPCKSASDTNTCPTDMTCQQTGASQGNGPGQGSGAGPVSGPGGRTNPVFHCTYPSEASGPFGPCADGTHTCGPALFCTGTSSSPSGVGYCSKLCSSDQDCDPPTSGSITPTCIIVDPGDNMMPPTKICGLDCPNAKNGCPDNESCMMVMTNAGPGMRCEYN